MEKLPNNIIKILEQFSNDISSILGSRLKKVILYGSYARGDYDENSDIDIMILIDLEVEKFYRFFTQISDIAYDIEEKNNFNILISPLIKNIDKFNYFLKELPFYANVNMEGVVLK